MISGSTVLPIMIIWRCWVVGRDHWLAEARVEAEAAARGRRPPPPPPPPPRGGRRCSRRLLPWAAACQASCLPPPPPCCRRSPPPCGSATARRTGGSLPGWCPATSSSPGSSASSSRCFQQLPFIPHPAIHHQNIQPTIPSLSASPLCLAMATTTTTTTSPCTRSSTCKTILRSEYERSCRSDRRTTRFSCSAFGLRLLTYKTDCAINYTFITLN